MTDKRIEFNIPIDDDGFVSLQCPFCRDIFKITSSDCQADDTYQLFCPYCGLVAEEGFHTDEIKEHALDLAKNEANALLNQFRKDFGKIFKGSKMFSFKPGAKTPMRQPKTLIEPTDMQEVKLNCCDRTIKLQYRVNGAYCPFCGVK